MIEKPLRQGNRMSKRILALVSWLSKGKNVWITIVPVVVTGTYLLSDLSERSIRLTGLFLQLCGISATVWVIWKTYKLFNLSISISVTPGQITASGNKVGICYALTPVDPNAPIESQIKQLETGIKFDNNGITTSLKGINDDISKIHKMLKEAHTERNQLESDLTKRIKSATTGEIHIAAMGAFWLLAGVILSTAAPEISMLFK